MPSSPPGMGYEEFRPQDSADLLRQVDTSKALVIPHQHPGGDWGVEGSGKMRLVEIYSHWGCFERPGCERPRDLGAYTEGSFVSEALAAGVRVGFVAGSDDHTGHPGNSFFWCYGNHPGGLTGVWAPDLTPEAAWQALYNRSCYGTTRARIVLRFFVNGAMMGSEIVLSAKDEPRHIEVEVHGTADIEEICVVRNGEMFGGTAPGALDAHLILVDEDPIPDGLAYWYYLRVKQEDGEMAWSSPVWVSG